MLPAKLLPEKGYFSVTHNEKEHTVSEFEALIGFGYIWIPSSNGNVPANAVMSGYTVNEEPLYIGRAAFKKSVTPGKVHQSHGCLYLPFGGKERSCQHYDVLVALKPRAVWIPWGASNSVPEGAIMAGIDSDGTGIYIGKASHEGDILPAKVIPEKEVAYICYGGEEVATHEFDILCGGETKWVRCFDGQIPAGAITGGLTSDNEILYIGRGNYEGSLTVGKVQPSHSILYIPFDGEEIPLQDYEVLTE